MDGPLAFASTTGCVPFTQHSRSKKVWRRTRFRRQWMTSKVVVILGCHFKAIFVHLNKFSYTNLCHFFKTVDPRNVRNAILILSTTKGEYIESCKKSHKDPEREHFRILGRYPHRITKGEIWAPKADSASQPLFKYDYLSFLCALKVMHGQCQNVMF